MEDKQRILEIFPEEQYSSNINVREKITHCKIKDKDINKNLCVFFSIDYEKTTTIVLKFVNKCLGNTGSMLLTKMEQLAKRIHATAICLEDESNIVFQDERIKISLKTLYLLTTGKTWYNANGYYGKNDDFVRNNELVRMSVRDFLNLCFRTNENVLLNVQEINDATGLSFEEPVNKYFSKIKTLLKTMDDNDALLQPIHKLIDFIDKSNIFPDSTFYIKHIAQKRRATSSSSIKRRRSLRSVRSTRNNKLTRKSI
jgi:hypothetical protein